MFDPRSLDLRASHVQSERDIWQCRASGVSDVDRSGFKFVVGSDGCWNRRSDDNEAVNPHSETCSIMYCASH